VNSFDSGNGFAVRPAPSAAMNLPSVCPACQSSSITTTVKSPDANSYWRCGSCGEIWNASRRHGMRGGANQWR
jgi:predicted Zn finger-like uncharacterized protein